MLNPIQITPNAEFSAKFSPRVVVLWKDDLNKWIQRKIDKEEEAVDVAAADQKEVDYSKNLVLDDVSDDVKELNCRCTEALLFEYVRCVGAGGGDGQLIFAGQILLCWRHWCFAFFVGVLLHWFLNKCVACPAIACH